MMDAKEIKKSMLNFKHFVYRHFHWPFWCQLWAVNCNRFNLPFFFPYFETNKNIFQREWRTLKLANKSFNYLLSSRLKFYILVSFAVCHLPLVPCNVYEWLLVFMLCIRFDSQRIWNMDALFICSRTMFALCITDSTENKKMEKYEIVVVDFRNGRIKEPWIRYCIFKHWMIKCTSILKPRAQNIFNIIFLFIFFRFFRSLVFSYCHFFGRIIFSLTFYTQN